MARNVVRAAVQSQPVSVASKPDDRPRAERAGARRRFRFAFTALAAGIAMIAGQAASAQVAVAPASLPPERFRLTDSSDFKTISSSHVGTFNGTRVRYDVEIAQTLLENEAGAPAISLMSFAYIAKPQPGRSPRPVLFAFNGGPGGSSAPMHLGALGPRILANLTKTGFADPQNKLVDNDKAPLDAVDLVFIDPADTGYSKSLPGADMAWLKSVDGDSESIAKLIAHWLRSKGRLGSPVFVIGESYGTMRAVALARDIPRVERKVKLAGVILSGSAYTYGQGGKLPNPAAIAARLPMMASLAWHHGRIDRSQSWEEAVAKARRFSRNEYVGALMDGYQISPERFESVAEQLTALIGIPASYFQQRQSLVVQDFNNELLKSEGLVLDRNDGRETDPVGPPRTADFDATVAGFQAAMDRYTSRELKAASLGEYRVLTPNLVKAVGDWNFTTYGPTALDGVLATAMRDQPCLQLGVLQGRYDALTNLGTTEYTLAQTNLPKARLTMQYFEGGHFLLPTSEVIGFVRSFTARGVQSQSTCNAGE